MESVQEEVSTHSTRKGKQAFEIKRGNTFAGSGRYKQCDEINKRKGKKRKHKQTTDQPYRKVMKPEGVTGILWYSIQPPLNSSSVV